MTQPKINWQDPTSDRIQQTTVDGVPCWQFSILKADPPLAWDTANNNRGPGGQINRRAEMSFAPADPRFKAQGPYNPRPGMTQTYGIRMRFKGGWPMNKGLQHDWAVEWQVHSPDDYKGNMWDGFHGISTHNGEVTLVTPNDPNGSYFFRAPIQTDVWGPHDYLLAVLWSKGADGFIKVADAKTKKILAQFNGPNFPAQADYMYGPIIGIYMDGAAITSDAILYMAGFEGPLPDINDGDLTVTAPAPAGKRNAAPFRPYPAPSVQPNDGADALMTIRDELVKLGDSRVQPQIDTANKLLGNGPWTP